MEVLQLGDACARFILARAAANRRPRTLEGYGERLARLRRLLGDDSDVFHLRAETLRTALLAVKQAPRGDGKPGQVSGRTVWHHHAVWRALFRWLEREEVIDRSPMRNIPAPAVDEQEVETFTSSEVRRLLATQSTATFLGARNRLTMRLLYDTGLRVGEAVRIKIEHIDFGGGVICIPHAKARRARRVPLSPMLRLHLRRFIDRWHRPALFAEIAPRHLLTDARGRALRDNAIGQWMKKAGRAAGITRVRVSPHTWRHTFATEYLRNGGTESGLMLIMGITTRRVLDRYLHLVRTEYARRQHRKASPLAKLGRA